MSAQSESITIQSVKQNATVVGIEPFYNETTFSITECYLMCQRQLERCSLVEIANVNEAWSCKLFHVSTTEGITKYLKPSKNSRVSRPKIKPKLNQKTKDCAELKTQGFNEGVHMITLHNGVTKEVFCDMTTDGGGWIVVQKRFDGSVDFYRNWNSYKNGFGDPKGEHWIGNEFIHQFTKANNGSTEMIVEAKAFDGERIAVELHNIQVGGEESKYRFQFNDCNAFTGKDGCIGWTFCNNMKFTTYDRDNDEANSSNCAVLYSGGWWFQSCYQVNLNGNYTNVALIPNGQNYNKRIHWFTLRSSNESLKTTRILIRKTQ